MPPHWQGDVKEGICGLSHMAAAAVGELESVMPGSGVSKPTT